MLCLARYTTQPAFGSSYESLVSLCFSHNFPALAAVRCHITGSLFNMRVTLMPGKDVAMRHFVTSAIQEPVVAWRDTARVCGANPALCFCILMG